MVLILYAKCTCQKGGWRSRASKGNPSTRESRQPGCCEGGGGGRERLGSTVVQAHTGGAINTHTKGSEMHIVYKIRIPPLLVRRYGKQQPVRKARVKRDKSDPSCKYVCRQQHEPTPQTKRLSLPSPTIIITIPHHGASSLTQRSM